MKLITSITFTQPAFFRFSIGLDFFSSFNPQDSPGVNAAHYPLVTDEKLRPERMCNKVTTKPEWSRITNPRSDTTSLQDSVLNLMPVFCKLLATT